MKLFLACVLIFGKMIVYASSMDNNFECYLYGHASGPSFILNEKGMTVLSGGWRDSILLSQSPINLKSGKITITKTISIQGEEERSEVSSKEIIKVSESSGTYILLIDKIPETTPEGIFYNGRILKGAFDISTTEGEMFIYSDIYCYGNSQILENVN